MSTRFEAILEIETMFRLIQRSMRKELREAWGETLTGTEFVLLHHLDLRGPQMITALAQEFEVSVSHITHVVDQLEREQYVARQRSQLDKRVVEVHITEKGQEKSTWMSEKRKEYLLQKFDPFTLDDLSVLQNLYKKLL
ncbi:MarR family winged helix-turn-helix transcriptional regulator [Thermoactinomyces sp. DSM 45892]|uniref:MarR family winged helix-turn-helix transcriptional regulator n=1 Tax=Thermoactinomyces sp. DSM 45892 TaxID=1882753 RepID=UPI000897F87F|nr:MarR family transcriptional regulator [Thermoactinomyces sp. DSM 45892]SDZ18633.1 DNA-binding transcriptional regulator, MarR family [Thermoactinomyces sp. DSM 45892]